MCTLKLQDLLQVCQHRCRVLDEYVSMSVCGPPQCACPCTCCPFEHTRPESARPSDRLCARRLLARRPLARCPRARRPLARRPLERPARSPFTRVVHAAGSGQAGVCRLLVQVSGYAVRGWPSKSQECPPLNIYQGVCVSGLGCSVRPCRVEVVGRACSPAFDGPRIRSNRARGPAIWRDFERGVRDV